MDLRTILLSQFPACFLLSVLFFINYLRMRKASAFKSILLVLLFAIALALAIVCGFLGIQAGMWTLKTLFHLTVWSWVGIVVVAIVLVLRCAHGIEKKLNQRKLDKALKKAEAEKNTAVAEAREAGRQEGKAESEIFSDAASTPEEKRRQAEE